ncbi:TPA: hypothetical protein MYM21_000399 [Klebsiella variicola subsp. variicola]|nr:hypothetical protein [Klebsiella variicola subsp. variicola]
MITAKIPHITLTGKDGYVFRKRYVAKTLYLALRTKEEQQAMQRGAAVSKLMDGDVNNVTYDFIKVNSQ